MPNANVSKFLEGMKTFRQNQAGGAVLLFALALPIVISLLGGAVDYSSIAHQRAKVQSVADSTAIAVAREMTLTAMTQSQVDANAQRYAAEVGETHGLKAFNVKGSITPDGAGIKVKITSKIVTHFGLIEAASGVSKISMEAVARIGQRSKLCLLALDELAVSKKNQFPQSTGKIGIELQNNSRLTANECIVYSNGAAIDTVLLRTGAHARVDLLCAVGGVRNDGGTVIGESLGSCPRISDPLEKRPLPLVAQKVSNLKSECGSKAAYQDLVISTPGVHRLSPKVYCGNVTISGDAVVNLDPGIFVFQGTLTVTGNSSLIGKDVGLFFSRGGAKSLIARFMFLQNSYIDLSAPIANEMQGILIWEEAKGAKQEAAISGANYHQINTARAKKLTGTIYLPAGHLLIDAPVQIAEQSDYTVLVVSRLDLADGPNLVLNSNYAGSAIPVPKGLGMIGARNIRLATQ